MFPLFVDGWLTPVRIVEFNNGARLTVEFVGRHQTLKGYIEALEAGGVANGRAQLLTPAIAIPPRRATPEWEEDTPGVEAAIDLLRENGFLVMEPPDR